jgi:hypothetical protein
MVPTVAAEPLDLRLNEDPFYFKFTRSDQFEPDETGMAPGLYILAAHLSAFLESGSSSGPKGGKVVGYDNYERRLANTLFIELAREGWIGTTSIGSRAVGEFVAESLGRYHSLTLAAIRDRPPAHEDESLPRLYTSREADDEDVDW